MATKLASEFNQIRTIDRKEITTNPNEMNLFEKICQKERQCTDQPDHEQQGSDGKRPCEVLI